MSIAALAKRVGFPRTTVGNWLKNGLPLEHLPVLLEVVGIPFIDLEDLRSRFEVELAQRSWAEPRAEQTVEYVKMFFDALNEREVYFLSFFDLYPIEWNRVLRPGPRRVHPSDLDSSAVAALDKGAHFLYLCPDRTELDDLYTRIGGTTFRHPLELCKSWLDSLGPKVRRGHVHFLELRHAPLFALNIKFAGVLHRRADGVALQQGNMLIPTRDTDIGGEIVPMSESHCSYMAEVLGRILQHGESLDVLDGAKRQIAEVLPLFDDGGKGA